MMEKWQALLIIAGAVIPVLLLIVWMLFKVGED